MDHWWIGSDNLIWIKQLRDVVEPTTYINNATVTAVLTDSDGQEVTGASSIALEHVSGSDGEYVGQIAASVSLTKGAQYTATVTIVGGGFTLVRQIVRTAAYKGET